MHGRAWLVLAALAVAAGAKAAVPLAAFGHLPSVDLIALSPDGSKVAMIVGSATERQLQVVRTAGHATVAALRIGAVKVRDLRWAGEDDVLVTRSTTSDIEGVLGPKREYSLALVLNLTTHRLRPLLDTPVSSGSERRDDTFEKLNTIDGVPMPRMIGGKPAVFLAGTSFTGCQGVSTLFRVDLDSRLMRTTVVAVGNEATSGWLVDAAGEVVARTDYAEATGRWRLFTGKGRRLVKSMEDVAPIDSPSLEGLGRTPDTVIVALNGDDAVEYAELPLGSDAAVPLPELTGGSLVTDPRTGLTIGAVRDAGLKVDYTFLSPADARLWAAIDRGFHGATVTLETWSDDRKTVVLRVEGKDFGAAFFLLDVPTHQASWLVNEYAEINAEDLGDKQLLHYPAADGTDIPAYLTLPPGAAVTTLPPGAAATKLPLVVLAHGGPSARDDPGFDWWAQALASRGYAVLQPQFRGSDGFGAKFLAAGFGEWGRKMQTDLSDGIAFLARGGHDRSEARGDRRRQLRRLCRARRSDAAARHLPRRRVARRAGRPAADARL